MHGFAQHFKLDPIKWNNPYNSLLSTVGNPDFAAAVLAILAVISFGIVVRKDREAWIRTLAMINVLIVFFDIYLAQVRQGLLAGGAGILFIIIVFKG